MRVKWILICALFSCTGTEFYRAELRIDSTHSIPFSLIKNGEDYIVINARERIGPGLLEQHMEGDTIVLSHRVFQSQLRFVNRDGILQGSWLDNSRGTPYRMPFRAVVSPSRFDAGQGRTRAAGTWRLLFSPGRFDEVAIGDLVEEGPQVTGTIRTLTGDHRFLEGAMRGDSLFLSTFDFAHAYLYEALIRGDSMNGMYYSGYRWREPFIGLRDDDAHLPDPEELIQIDSTLQGVVRFEDLDGNPMDLGHPLFKDRAIVIQLFGSWCPNCYDESRVLQELHTHYWGSGIVFIGVGFERAPDKRIAIQHIGKFRNGLGITYPLAYGGPADKDAARSNFPALGRVMAFPTLLFYDRDHRLVGIHSGFNGPGTGPYHEREVQQLRQQVRALVNSGPSR